MSEEHSCSEYSLALGESMRGTAPRVDFWLLLEYPEMWTRDPIDTNKLPTEIQHWLERTVTSLRDNGRFPRVQMIRRDRNKRSAYSLYVAEQGTLRHHMVRSYDDILDLDVHKSEGERVSSNMYFICTHGTRDKCCATFGYRTWKVLHKLSIDQVWQCSHLGGHRFAPNILVLPQGRLYGRVHAKKAKSFYRIIENGEIAIEYVRGRSEFGAAEQVQEIGLEPVRDGPLDIRESCSKKEFKTVYPFIET